MIAMHQSGGSDFMANQYASRRLQYFKELISLLTTSKFNATGLETFPLIHALTRENYVESGETKLKSRPRHAFDQTLEFYRKRSNVVEMKNASRGNKESPVLGKKSPAAESK